MESIVNKYYEISYDYMKFCTKVWSWAICDKWVMYPYNTLKSHSLNNYVCSKLISHYIIAIACFLYIVILLTWFELRNSQAPKIRCTYTHLIVLIHIVLTNLRYLYFTWVFPCYSALFWKPILYFLPCYMYLITLVTLQIQIINKKKYKSSSNSWWIGLL